MFADYYDAVVREKPEWSRAFVDYRAARQRLYAPLPAHAATDSNAPSPRHPRVTPSSGVPTPPSPLPPTPPVDQQQQPPNVGANNAPPNQQPLLDTVRGQPRFPTASITTPNVAATEDAPTGEVATTKRHEAPQQQHAPLDATRRTVPLSSNRSVHLSIVDRLQEVADFMLRDVTRSAEFAEEGHRSLLRYLRAKLPEWEAVVSLHNDPKQRNDDARVGGGAVDPTRPSLDVGDNRQRGRSLAATATAGPFLSFALTASRRESEVTSTAGGDPSGTRPAATNGGEGNGGAGGVTGTIRSVGASLGEFVLGSGAPSRDRVRDFLRHTVGEAQQLQVFTESCELAVRHLERDLASWASARLEELEPTSLKTRLSTGGSDSEDEDDSGGGEDDAHPRSDHGKKQTVPEHPQATASIPASVVVDSRSRASNHPVSPHREGDRLHDDDGLPLGTLRGDQDRLVQEHRGDVVVLPCSSSTSDGRHQSPETMKRSAVDADNALNDAATSSGGRDLNVQPTTRPKRSSFRAVVTHLLAGLRQQKHPYFDGSRDVEPQRASASSINMIGLEMTTGVASASINDDATAQRQRATSGTTWTAHPEPQAPRDAPLPQSRVGEAVAADDFPPPVRQNTEPPPHGETKSPPYSPAGARDAADIQRIGVYPHPQHPRRQSLVVVEDWPEVFDPSAGPAAPPYDVAVADGEKGGGDRHPDHVESQSLPAVDGPVQDVLNRLPDGDDDSDDGVDEDSTPVVGRTGIVVSPATPVKSTTANSAGSTTTSTAGRPPAQTLAMTTPPATVIVNEGPHLRPIAGNSAGINASSSTRAAGALQSSSSTVTSLGGGGRSELARRKSHLIETQQAIQAACQRLTDAKRHVSNVVTFLEATFAKWFKHGNLQSSRISIAQRRSIAADSFNAGFTLCLIVSTILYWLHVAYELDPSPDAWLHAARIYPVTRLFVSLSFACCLWAIVIRFLERYRINYLYVFEFPQFTTASSIRILEHSLAMLFVSLLTGVIYLRSQLSEATTFYASSKGFPKWSPYILFGGISIWLAVGLFFPPRYALRNARAAFFRVFLDIVTLPFVKTVKFVQFFIADWGTSLSIPCGDLLYTVCYVTATPSVATATDSDHAWAHCANIRRNHNFPIAMIPFIWRAMQTFKMYLQTGNRAHLVNHGKYQACLAAIIFQWIYQLNVSTMGTAAWANALWWLLRVGSQLYAYVWDILMDWGFVRGVNRRLLFPSRNVYVVAGVLDGLARFFFIPAVFWQATGSISVDSMLLLQGLLEITRRSMWSVFRVENENTNNLETYRAVDFVPQMNLPAASEE